ncbi:hypothetical protein UK23_31535 [Lentzea aerocolonigenes]|uniref:Ricin B lectin domain-containing protein n=1 Tax=Lentzea aerocolonigenes TaxID=68170 RepID=A0A0F0GMM2_LENAE|nr:hypothetical protein [Lentzea aerocolonigenes]KJK43831.1 hypothetical protein UK23_31535 [Lentzea aerocolonigenes]
MKLFVVAAVVSVVSGLAISYALTGPSLHDEDLLRTCTTGEAHSKAAALSTGEPATRTFADTTGVYAHRPALDQLPVADPAQVQLVACLRRTGSGAELNTCNYGNASRVVSARTTLHQGSWELTVYEARTGRRIVVRELAGTTDSTCPGSTILRGGEAADYTEPAHADIRAAIPR